jgi:hypothetical protein
MPRNRYLVPIRKEAQAQLARQEKELRRIKHTLRIDRDESPVATPDVEVKVSRRERRWQKRQHQVAGSHPVDVGHT